MVIDIFLGNNIDFLNYVYLNETGSCFYLIRNREFFKQGQGGWELCINLRC